MACQINKIIKSAVSLIIILTSLFLPHTATSDAQRVTAGNFGLPGIIDLPTARRFPDGELVVTQQLHKSLARSGISFQALASCWRIVSLHRTRHQWRRGLRSH